MKRLEFICEWKLSYDAQVESEEEFTKDNSGTEGFRRIGCDKCSGFSENCRKYNPSERRFLYHER